MISLRLRLAIFYALTMSFFYSLAMAAFRGSFTPATWFGFWALHFIHLVVHSLTFLTAAVIASPALQAPIFLLVLVVNLTAGNGTPELSHIFYTWIYGLPFYHVTVGSRTLLFGGYPRLGYNFGSLIGWIIGFSVAYVFFQSRALMDEEAAPLQRSSTIHDLEKSLTGTLRASRQFSFREADEGGNMNERRKSVSRSQKSVDEPEHFAEGGSGRN